MILGGGERAGNLTTVVKGNLQLVITGFQWILELNYQVPHSSITRNCTISTVPIPFSWNITWRSIIRYIPDFSAAKK